MPVSVVKVQQADVPLTGQWVGTLDGFVNAQIQPQVSGYLIRQNYREGSVVSKGQVLFEIDPRPFQALVDQAKGQLEQAQGQVAQAQAQVGAGAGAAWAGADQREARHAARRRRAPSRRASSITTSSRRRRAKPRCVPRKPTCVRRKLRDGRAGRRRDGEAESRLHAGPLADHRRGRAGHHAGGQSRQPAIRPDLRFAARSHQGLLLHQRHRISGAHPRELGRAAAISLHGQSNVPLTLTLANGQVYPQKGRVVFVDRQMNQQTGAIRIAAAFPNPGNVLRPGQFARVSAETEVRHNALLVPQIAVQELQGMQAGLHRGPG